MATFAKTTPEAHDEDSDDLTVTFTRARTTAGARVNRVTVNLPLPGFPGYDGLLAAVLNDDDRSTLAGLLKKLVRAAAVAQGYTVSA